MTTEFCIETRRLRLRWLEAADADFIYRLVNDPCWLEYIGDKQVYDRDGARRYIDDGPREMYRRFGFGLNRVALRENDTPIGISGLLQRESLPGPDLGFAFLPRFRGHGYALEAAMAVLEHAFEVLDFRHICAIVSAGNDASVRLLEKLGFGYQRQVRMQPNAPAVGLYRIARRSSSMRFS